MNDDAKARRSAALVRAIRMWKPEPGSFYSGERAPLGGKRFSTKPSDSEDRVHTSPRGGGQYSVGGEYD